MNNVYYHVEIYYYMVEHLRKFYKENNVKIAPKKLWYSRVVHLYLLITQPLLYNKCHKSCCPNWNLSNCGGNFSIVKRMFNVMILIQFHFNRICFTKLFIHLVLGGLVTTNYIHSYKQIIVHYEQTHLQ